MCSELEQAGANVVATGGKVEALQQPLGGLGERVLTLPLVLNF